MGDNPHFRESNGARDTHAANHRPHEGDMNRATRPVVAPVSSAHKLRNHQRRSRQASDKLGVEFVSECERERGRERFSVLKIQVWKGFRRDRRRSAEKQIPPSCAIEPRNLSLVFLRDELQQYPASFPHACNKHARTRGGPARIWSVRCLSCWEYARTPGAFGALWQGPAGEVKLHSCGDCCTGPQRRRFDCSLQWPSPKPAAGRSASEGCRLHRGALRSRSTS